MNKKTNRMTIFSLLLAIELLLGFIPFLGFIPLGVIHATTMHIPVIVGAILLGKKEGAALGLVFGLISIVKNTMEPNVTSFVFTPFITFGQTTGNFSSLIIAIVPRILIGFFSGWCYEILSKKINKTLAISISSALGSLTNTFLVLSGIYIFYGSEYASAREIPFQNLSKILMGIILSSGVGEMIVAIILCTSILLALFKITKGGLKS